MAETLGSLCDKLTIIKLKQFHTDDKKKLIYLTHQEEQLIDEMNCFVKNVVSGDIPIEKLVFSSCKIYKRKGNKIARIKGSIGAIVSTLADTNCKLWHEQEKVYDFEKVPASEKDAVVKKLAVLNLERNRCIDGIDRFFQDLIKRNLEQNR